MGPDLKPELGSLQAPQERLAQAFQAYRPIRSECQRITPGTSAGGCCALRPLRSRPLVDRRWRQATCMIAPRPDLSGSRDECRRGSSWPQQRLRLSNVIRGAHPETSGFSHARLFPQQRSDGAPGAQDHYTERLVTLPNLSIYYERSIRKRFRSIDGPLAMRSTATVFWCGQSLFKYLPQFDWSFSHRSRSGRLQFAFIQYDQGHISMSSSCSGLIGRSRL